MEPGKTSAANLMLGLPSVHRWMRPWINEIRRVGRELCV